MKRLIFKALFPTLCIISILFSCCSFSVSAVDVVVTPNRSEPMYSDTAGYFALIYEFNNGSYGCYVFDWHFAASSTSFVAPVMNIDYDNDSITFSCSPQSSGYLFLTIYQQNSTTNKYPLYYRSYNSGEDVSYTFNLSTDLTYWTYQAKGNFGKINNNSGNGISNTFSILWDEQEDIYNAIYDNLEVLSEYLSNIDNSAYYCTEYLDSIEFILANLFNTAEGINENLLTSIELLNTAVTKIDNILSECEYTNEQLAEFFDFLYTFIQEDLYYFLENQDVLLSSIDGGISSINQKLKQLLDGPKEGFTESPTLSDKQNEYNEIEDELLNDEAASDAQSSIDIQINENAMSYIWDLITQFLQANSKVFGLFISVLSLGIIALILNR